jgi:hypothetical protein
MGDTKRWGVSINQGSFSGPLNRNTASGRHCHVCGEAEERSETTWGLFRVADVLLKDVPID